MKNFPKYTKQRAKSADWLLGMLYIVEVRLVVRTTRETIKHTLLMVGCEEQDIERKLSWIFDKEKYSEFSLKSAIKVRDKIHFLNTVYSQPTDITSPIIAREDRTEIVPQQSGISEPYKPKLFAIGLSTTMLGRDETHAIRKLSNALMTSVTEGKSHSGAALSDESTFTIEEIPLASGIAVARDTSNEVNKASFVRG